MAWPDTLLRRVRHEARFGDRVIRCLVDRPANVDAMLRAAVKDHGDREALVADQKRLTYRDLDRTVDAVAANLWTRYGVRAGDRVAVYAGNSLETVYVLLATVRIGALAVPLGDRLRRTELQFMIDDSGARVLVYDVALAENVPEGSWLPALEHRIAFGTGKGRGADDFARLLASGTPPEIQIAEEETAFILYTSGTTGRPKGAMLTHFNIAHSVLNYIECMALRPGDRSLMAVPIAHVTGLVAQLLTMIGVGGCTVMMHAFKARETLETLEKERISHVIFVPTMFNLMLREPDFDAVDLSFFRVGGFGGAPMPEQTIIELQTKVPHLGLFNAYGATETTSPATLLPSSQVASHRHSVGVPVPCADIRIMDDHGCEVPRGEIGEIWIGGPMVIPGYWMNSDATVDSFTGGYWRSGDIGLMDAHGYLEVLDRSKDMINRAGYKVYSAEVENVLNQHPGIVEAAVVSKPCPVLGERVHAFVVVAGTGTGDRELSAFCSERLADYKVPESFSRVESLPRNANGKVMKPKLRERIRAEMGAEE